MVSRSYIWRIFCYPKITKFFSVQVNMFSAYKIVKAYVENYLVESFQAKSLGYFFAKMVTYAIYPNLKN